MSQGMNKVMLCGNLGADPELKLLPSGTSVLKMRLATTDTWVDKDSVKQERTDWHRVTVFGKRAEALSAFLKKGEKLIVEGRIQTSSYEKDGQKRYSTDIIATEIVLLGRRPDSGFAASGGRPSHAADVRASELPF